MCRQGRQAHVETSSILPLSINVGLKEISWSKQQGAEDEGADLTDDISVDISTLAASHQYERLLLMDRQHFAPALIFSVFHFINSDVG